MRYHFLLVLLMVGGRTAFCSMDLSVADKLRIDELVASEFRDATLRDLLVAAEKVDGADPKRIDEAFRLMREQVREVRENSLRHQ